MKTHKIAMFQRVHPNEAGTHWEQKIRERAEEVRWRLQLMYRGRAIIDLREFVWVTTATVTSGNLFAASARQSFIDNGGTDGWQPDISHVVGGTSGGAVFGGEARGSASMALRNTGYEVSWHEIGHNLGAPHSRDYDDYSNPYGGIDFMSDKHMRPDMMTSLRLGLVDESKSLTVHGESVECILSQLESLPEDVVEGTYSFLKVEDPESEDVYYVSNVSSEPYCSGNPFEVHVRVVNRDGSWQRCHYGRETSINGNYQFEFVEERNGLSKVRAVYKGQQPQPVEFPRRFSPVDTSKLNDAISGVWYDPTFNGQGLGIHYLEGRDEVLLFWYTHSSNTVGESHPRWYMAQGKITEPDYFEMRVYSSVQGRQLVDAGYASLAINGNEGKFRYVDEAGKSRLDYNIVRLSPEGEHSVWYDPLLEKEGFQIFNWEDQLVAFWYGYGPVTPGGAFRPIEPATAQRWWMYEAEKTAEGRYVGKLYEVREGILFHPKKPDIKVIKEGVTMEIQGSSMKFSELPQNSFIPLI